MTDCENVAVREALPDLVHEMLPEAERVRVLMHVRDCDACTDELSIIRAVLTIQGVPAVNVTAISAAIPPYPRAVPQGRFRSAHLRLAAALVLGAVGISALAIEHQRAGDASVGVVSHAAPVASATLAQPGVALVGTADLSDDHLAQLIQSMAHIDAAPPAEPEPITPVAYEADAS